MHRALAVGPRVTLDDRLRDGLAARLPAFELTLRKDGQEIERGVGRNVLDSPALALGHLVRLLAAQPGMPALAPGEIVTTGTLTDAWFVAPGQTWSSDYGDLGVTGVVLRLS
jgi:2-oxo-3-hexenedioate decarboxylase